MHISYKAIGRNIREGRKKRGLTQEEMSRMMEISVTHFGRIERGAHCASLEQIAAIAHILNMSVEALLEGMTEFRRGREDIEKRRIGVIIDFLSSGCSDEAQGLMIDVCALIAKRDKYGVCQIGKMPSMNND